MSAAGVCADYLPFPWSGYAFRAVHEEEGAGAETASVRGGDIEVVAALEDVGRFGFKVDQVDGGTDNV